MRSITPNRFSVSTCVRLLVGSSIMSTRGSPTSARAISTSCCWAMVSCPDRGVERHLRLANFLQRSLGQAAALAVADPTKRRWLPAQQDIFLHGKIGCEVQLLIYHRHAAFAGVQWIARLKRLAVESETACVRSVRAAEHLHQRAFAGAVFADERVHLPGGDFETHAVQRDRRAEALGYPVDSQPGKRGVAG